jgi:hypothetical protein
MNNPYNPFFPQLQWTGLPETYNYNPYFPTAKPFSSRILFINGETRLEYVDIEAGEINAQDLTIPNLINIHLVATEKIRLNNIMIENGAVFSSTIIDCPNDNRGNFTNKNSNANKKNTINSVYKSTQIDNIKIYPNPANSTINIDTKKDIKSISISNTLGSVVLYKEIHANKSKIDIALLISGIYIIKIIMADGATHIEKIIKE